MTAKILQAAREARPLVQLFARVTEKPTLVVKPVIGRIHPRGTPGRPLRVNVMAAGFVGRSVLGVRFLVWWCCRELLRVTFSDLAAIYDGGAWGQGADGSDGFGCAFTGACGVGSGGSAGEIRKVRVEVNFYSESNEGRKEPKFRWDHKTKPSTCVVEEGGKELFRGTWVAAMEVFERVSDEYWAALEANAVNPVEDSV